MANRTAVFKMAMEKLSVRPEQAWMVVDDLAAILRCAGRGIFLSGMITGKPDYLKTQKLSPIELSITYPITHGL